MTTDLVNRHDILILFDVTNGNPNGDPDAGNMPRIDPTSNHGLVSDVCLKRKVRNYVEAFPPPRDPGGNEDAILIRQGAVIEREQNKAIEASKKEELPGASPAERAKNWLCRKFFDVRTFGGVLSTGDKEMKGSAYGQVRGPVQFTFARSVDPVVPLEVTITRCAVTKEEDAQKERTMGNKFIVPYALYVAKAYVSPAFAENTGFSRRDLGVVLEALGNLFENDRSAARGEMVVRGLYDFEHVGTQSDSNADQKRRETRLGCAHAHELFECIAIAHDEEHLASRPHPSCFRDYRVTVGFDERRFPGVKLSLLVPGTAAANAAA